MVIVTNIYCTWISILLRGGWGEEIERILKETNKFRLC